MRAELLATGDAAWRDALARIAGADAYDLPEYHRVAEANGDGDALAFLVEDGGEVFLHPFLRRPLERVGSEPVGGGWCDLESVYGYTGPLATTADRSFLDRCWGAFDGWCRESRVVAEFVRFNPLRDAQRLAPPGMEVVLDRETVAVPLAGGAEALWSSYASTQRNMVRKAQSAGLVASEVPAADGMPRFRALYDETMHRVEASAYYRFGERYFAALAELGGTVRMFEVRRGGELAAAALFLVRPPRMHYHLAGGRSDLRSLAPNNLLLHAAASWGIERGLDVLHLGGGRTPAADDPLLRFKASLSRVRLPFRTGRRVHDPRMYDTLCSSWLRQARPQTRPPYFLLYRLEVAQ